MTCCSHCQSAERYFNRRVAEGDLREYRKHGPTGTTRQLIDALEKRGVAGQTLLDIGGGIGVIQHELAAAGVTRITGVDASNAYLVMARQEAAARGYVAEVSYVHADFVAVANQLDAADIVTLDRVVCCYPDMEALVSAAAERTNRVLGLVYPRDVWWMRLGIRILNAYLRLRGDAFRVFVHPTAAVESIVAANRLQRADHQQGSFWQVAVYTR